MNKYGKVSIITAGLVLPITLLLSGAVAWYYKSTNPNGVDITIGLAYLRPILVTAFTAFAIVWALSLVSGLFGLKRDASKELSKVGLILLVLVTITSLGAGVTSKKVAEAEEAYRVQQLQTLDVND
ncbi:hypothetical protein KBD20_04145 [Candidatus Saccharibacteria bacterium]|nr:hypothetical protein [Candidatus Saccharibacteria bacterium]